MNDQPLAAFIGIGHTDYGADFRGKVVRRAEDMAIEALDAALEDCGLARADIDGLAISRGPAGLKISDELIAELGLKPGWTMPHGLTHPFDAAIAALAQGEAKTIAVVYASAQKSTKLQYGGPNSGSLMFPSYYYYHPWGFSSQGAHWAMLFKRYQEVYGVTEEQLGAVAVMDRANALLNPYAVMNTPLTIDEYLATRYVCRPLRLLDYCMPVDGGVAFILTRADLAQQGRQTPVDILGRATVHTSDNDAGQLRALVLDMQQTVLGQAMEASLAQADIARSDIDHFQCYDAFSINMPISLEGLGFCKPGEGLRFIADGRGAIGGELPTNTSGGLLSEAYLHSWNQYVEAVRQLRGQAGPRQVKDAEISCFSFFESESANVTMMRRRG